VLAILEKYIYVYYNNLKIWISWLLWSNQENADKISKEFGYKHFSTIATLIHAVDVIDIVTPTLSYKCAKVAIKSGKHVFIENPSQIPWQKLKKL
jgi:predicted dehydrogenase